MVAKMRDVAALAGVSLKTVSNVINHYPHITPRTRAKVEAAIAALDYRPNITARAFRYGRAGVVALAVPDLATHSFAQLAAAVGRAANRQDYALLIEQTDGDPDAERLALDGLRHRLVDGVLFWPAAGTAPATTITPDRPVVLLDTTQTDAGALARAAVDLLIARLR